MRSNKPANTVLISSVINLIAIATSALAITGYFAGHHTVFLICSILSAVVSFGMIVGLVSIASRSSWGIRATIIFISLLILIIGMLIDHSLMPGLLLGASMLGFVVVGHRKIYDYWLKRRLLELDAKHTVKSASEPNSTPIESSGLPEDRVERVRMMEDAFNRVSAMIDQLNKAISSYKREQDDLDLLREYLDSDQWIMDFDADGAGELPKDMPRGVLSEDGLYNLLNDVEDVEDRIMNIVRGFAAAGMDD